MGHAIHCYVVGLAVLFRIMFMEFYTDNPGAAHPETSRCSSLSGSGQQCHNDVANGGAGSRLHVVPWPVGVWIVDPQLRDLVATQSSLQ